jgi:hypothetical protein
LNELLAIAPAPLGLSIAGGIESSYLEQKKQSGRVRSGEIDRNSGGRQALTGWMDGKLERRLIGRGIAGGGEGEREEMVGEEEWGLGVAWLNATRTQRVAYVALPRFPRGRMGNEVDSRRLLWIGSLDWNELHG